MHRAPLQRAATWLAGALCGGAFDGPRDAAAIEEYAGIFRRRGGRVVFAELEASQAERLRRNETEFRLAEKPFKRDLAASRRQLVEDDARYQLNSRGVFDDSADYFRLETTELTAGEAAARILAHFALPGVDDTPLAR